MNGPDPATGAATAAEARPPVTTPDPAAATAATSGTSKKTNPRLTKALEDLKRTLTKDQRASFQACDKKDVEAAISSIQTTLGAQRRLANLQRLSRFIDMVGQLTIATGDFVSINGPSNFLWAPLRHALVQASGPSGFQSHCLDKLLDILGQIGDIFPHLNEYQELFARHPDVIFILDDYREAILRFHAGLMEVFNKSAWRTMFDSSWGRFSRIAEETKHTLRRNRKLLCEAKATASMREILALRDQITQQGQLAASRDDDASKEPCRIKLQEIVNKLAAPQYLDDQSDLQRRTHEFARGDWLLRDERFVRWADLDDEDHKVLDLNGCPGAGKTFLTSRIIQHLQEVQKRPFAEKRISLAYFMFKHDSDNKAKATYTAALRALIEQLVKERADGTLLDHAFRLLSTVHTPSRDLLVELASTAVRAKRLCFIVLDGLDECEAADQGVLLRWLKELTSESGESPLTLRILLSGRREGYLEKEIASFPNVSSVRIDASKNHELCIQLYAEKEAEVIQNTFGANNDTKEKIVEKIMSKAKGMFLFAHVVLQCLLGLATLEDLLEELQDDVFPSKLNDVYDRVAVQVFEAHPNRSSSTRPRLSRQHIMAKQLLSWISCAARPLYWREIQARFMIDHQVGPQPDAYQRMTRYSPKDLCGCFVDVSGAGSDSERTVHIVHRTAAEYLQHKDRIPSTTAQHAEMLSFCCQYLNSNPFIKPVTAQIRQEHARTGYYAFQDYAAAHWWDHAKALGSDQQLPQHQESSQAIAQLAKLLANYDKSTEHSPDSPEVNLSNILAKLDPSASERNEVLLVEHRISMVREGIVSVQEEAATSQDRDFSLRMERIYGPLRHKCPKPWCSGFHLGFETPTQLQHHKNAHDRPFRCPREGCAVSALGFASKKALETHHKRFHPAEKASLFSVTDDSSIPWHKLLTRAIRDGSLERVKALMSSSTSIDKAFGERKLDVTPLVEAIRCGQFHICEYFLEVGAKVNHKSTGRRRVTPLREAIAANDQEIFDLLLRQDGVDTLEELSVSTSQEQKKHHLSDMRYDTLGFALACSSINFIRPLLIKTNLRGKRHSGYFQALASSRAPGRGENFSLLRKHLPGFSLDHCDHRGRSLFTLAAEHNNVEVMGFILAAGFNDINQQCKKGKTALMRAAGKGSTAAIRTIVADDRFVPGIRSKAGRTAYSYAADAGHLHVLEALFAVQYPGIDQADNSGKTPLFYAKAGAHVDCVQWLLATGSVVATHVDNDGPDIHALGDLDIERLPAHFKKLRDDWFIIFNPNVPRILDVDLLHTLQHESVVCCVRFSADGKYVATGCNRIAYIFDVATGEKICMLQDESVENVGDMHIRGVCFSPDDKYLATAGEDKLIRVWDIASKQIRTQFSGHEQAINSLDFARDGRTIVSGSWDRTIKLWDIETDDIMLTLAVEDAVVTVAISPDAKYVAAGSLDKSVRVWDLHSGFLVERFEGPDGHKDSVYSVAFSPNGKDLVSGSMDKTIKMWELAIPRGMPNQGPEGGRCVKTFEGHKDFVRSVALTPDAQWVMSGSKDRGVQFWDPRTGNTQLMLQGHKNSVISVAPSPAGGYFATGSRDMRARIWSYNRLGHGA